MAICRRRTAVLALILLLTAVVLGGQLPTAERAAAQGGEAFNAPLVPGKLYAGDVSHDLLVAIPSSGLQGYCVEVRGEGHVGLNTNTFGFRIASGPGEIVYDPLDPNAPNNPQYFDNGSATTIDDVYCVAVRALPRAPSPTPAGMPIELDPPIVIAWDYLVVADNEAFTALSEPIPVVTVRLTGFDGVVGGRALVCTEGWDATFLTGQDSNPNLSRNPVDDVRLVDWTVLTAGVAAIGEPFINTSDFTSVNPDGGDPLPRREWCLTVVATDGAPHANIVVEFDFVAVYDPTRLDDDTLHTVSSFGAGIDLKTPTAPELRHATTDGYLVESAMSDNAISSTHTVCVLPTEAGDALDQVIIDGSPSVTRFADADAANGIPDGTLCFRWSSSLPATQFISATVDYGPPPGLTGSDVRAVWDTDADGNGFRTDPSPDDASRLLAKRWWQAHSTRITTGTDFRNPDANVTGKMVDIPVVFNAGTGAFIGSTTLNEWVLGAAKENPGEADLFPLDGIRTDFTILPGRDGQNVCGHFVGTGLPAGAQAFTTTTSSGRVEFTVSIAPDAPANGCLPGDLVLVTIDTFYANGDPTGIPQETVILRVGIEGQYNPPQSVPQVLWAGQTATIFYGFAARSCVGLVATFVSPEDQPGAFISGSGQNGAKSVTIPFDEDDCSASVQYESENQGAVDIVATFVDTDDSDGIISGDFSKVYFPLFYLAFEDLTLSGPDSLIVSERGELSAQVRGWFTSTNPSGRTQDTTFDGRTLPADRWVLPDDWEHLRGDPDFREWPGSAPMPPAHVTFFMENEGIANDYPGEARGAAGFFVRDSDRAERDFNVNPNTGQPSILGSTAKPRIISETTDSDGFADTGIFGDFNLGFDECAPNPQTGNPHCEPGDLVGKTRYYALVDYPEWRKNPPLRSNTTDTAFTWAGYKRLSVVDTENPGIKYVVAHLKDRDGFCNAIGFNNVLGNQVLFQIDAGGGIILDARDLPIDVSINKRAATAITFDTMNDLGELMNEDMAQPVMEPDECQAWIKVSNSLLSDTNVMVTFPAPPVPLPGNVRVTQLVCGAGGYAVVSNLGDEPVSLNGFGLRSGGGDPDDEQHLGLAGLLEPGASITLPGDTTLAPWLDASDPVFSGGGDYARLVWNEFEVSRVHCNGTTVNPDLPASFALDGEGEIVLDITVNFGQQTAVPLVGGWNLVSAPGSGAIGATLGADASKVTGIYYWDAAAGAWKRYISDAPGYVNSLDRFEAGEVYWVQVKQPFTLRMTR